MFSAMILISQVSLGLLRDLGDLEDRGFCGCAGARRHGKIRRRVELLQARRFFGSMPLTAFLMMHSGFFSSSSA